MSKRNKFRNKKNPPKAFPFLQDEQQHGIFSPLSKWNDPQYTEQLQATHRMRESNKLDWQTASDLISTPKSWLFLNFLQEGELAVLAGSPNGGKTTLACALAAGVTIGRSYSLHSALTPNGSGYVIIVNREDDPAKGLTPRLEAAGANLDKIRFIGGKIGLGDDSPFSFSNERDILRLMGKAEELENNIGLIIIDPIYFAVDGDPSSNHNARVAYEGLTALAKCLKCAILGIAHTAKNTQGKDGLGRIAGPGAVREVPREVILLSKILNGPTETGGTHVLVHAKNNEGKTDGGFEYCLTPVELPSPNGKIETVKFVVTRQLFGSTENILEQADRGITVEKMSKLDCAVKFLQTVLKDGPRLRIEIEKLAEEADVKIGTLLAAKSFLMLVTKKRKGDGRSVWCLPDAEDANDLMD